MHDTHSAVTKRLKRAEGHLRSIIQMVECERNCLEVAQQMHAVCAALENAKQVYIRDHIDHCLEDAAGKPGGARRALVEFKEIAKYL